MAVVFQDPEWEMGEVIITITIVPRSASVDVFPLLGAVFLEECSTYLQLAFLLRAKLLRQAPEYWRSVCAVAAAPERLLREGKRVWPWASRAFLCPGIRRKLRSRRKQCTAGYCIALSKDLVYCYGGQQRSTILAKWKCAKNLSPTRPPYLDLLTL